MCAERRPARSCRGWAVSSYELRMVLLAYSEWFPFGLPVNSDMISTEEANFL
jgi:hypothetical protein